LLAEKISSGSFQGWGIIRETAGQPCPSQIITPAGEHAITVPMHKEIAPGTLNDILSKVSIWKGISKDELIRMLT
jgi:hypothetical protein